MSKPYIYVFSTAYAPFIGGAEIAIAEGIKRLQYTFDFFIITARFRRDLPSREVKDGIIIIRVGFGYELDRFLLPFLGFFVVRKLSRQRPPSLYWAVMVSFASGIPYMLNIFSAKKVPIVLTLQEGDPESYLRHGRGGIMGLAWRL